MSNNNQNTMSPDEVAACINEYGLSDMFLYANLLTSNDPEVVLNDNTPIPTFATVLTNAAAAVEVAELVAATDGGADQTNHPQPAVVQEEPLLPTKTDQAASGSKKAQKKRPRSTQLHKAAEKKVKQKYIKKKAEKLQKRKPSIKAKKQKQVKSDKTGEGSNQNDSDEDKEVTKDQAGGSGTNENQQVMSDLVGGSGTNDLNQATIPVPSTFPTIGPNMDNLGLMNNHMYYNDQEPYYPVMPGIDTIPDPMMMPSYLPLNQVPLAILNSLFPSSELLFTPPASPTVPAPPSSSWPTFPGDKSDV